ncbi:lipopolysaccharide-induced tumor necrosis factor-alpha factor homolog [Bombina bombina]|uniref:lipopolysaccharide-induced tumor necrosis factor-alpha factor homolog n=1 Tax=Bombina bombina TaxID=8345 RepID=UPI00235A5D69|nr:lipopolysaccharide-induced tumor necrosis factor-alpha factor homolog [Bombina bombina]
MDYPKGPLYPVPSAPMPGKPFSPTMGATDSYLENAPHPPPYSLPYGTVQPPMGATDSYLENAPHPPPYSLPYGTVQPPMVAAVQTTVVLQNAFHDTPVCCICPICHQNIVTRTEYKTGLLTWAVFGGLILFGCWLGCCLIPFCVDSCKDVDHFCPNCNHHLQKYRRL